MGRLGWRPAFFSAASPAIDGSSEPIGTAINLCIEKTPELSGLTEWPRLGSCIADQRCSNAIARMLREIFMRPRPTSSLYRLGPPCLKEGGADDTAASMLRRAGRVHLPRKA